MPLNGAAFVPIACAPGLRRATGRVGLGTAAMGFERDVRLEYGDADGMDGARKQTLKGV
jgi:hypothetical protein